MKNMVNELIKNFKDVSFEEYERASFNQKENVLYNVWYKDHAGTLRITYSGDDIENAVLDMPGSRVETLRTNEKLGKLSRKVLKI